ncbi:DNA-polymerase III subunit tau [Sesbania bispinosa]|nr:DNA-polymerase III subunit tau [Sesbania bispinosa]
MKWACEAEEVEKVGIWLRCNFFFHVEKIREMELEEVVALFINQPVSLQSQTRKASSHH